MLTKATDEPKRAKRKKEKCKEHVPVAVRSGSQAAHKRKQTLTHT